MSYPLGAGWSIGHQREGRWRRSFRMLGVSWRLLWRTGAMRAVAAVSFVTWLIASIVLFGPVVYWWAQTEERWTLVVGSALAAYPFIFVTVYFNVALLAAASACMDGRRMTVRQSFAVATRRVPQIAGWALLAAGVGALLDALAEYVPGFGAIASWILGVAWSLATLFAVPIIALEGAGARQAARTSARVFRERWGESLIGFVSITVCTSLLAFPGAALLCGGAFAGTSPTTIVVLAIGVLLIAVAAFIATTMDRLFALALYRFAVEGEPGGGFTESDLRRGVFFESPRRRGWLGGSR